MNSSCKEVKVNYSAQLVPDLSNKGKEDQNSSNYLCTLFYWITEFLPYLQLITGSKYRESSNPIFNVCLGLKPFEHFSLSREITEYHLVREGSSIHSTKTTCMKVTCNSIKKIYLIRYAEQFDTTYFQGHEFS